MKKILSLIIITAMILSLAACGSSAAPASSSASQKSEQPSAASSAGQQTQEQSASSSAGSSQTAEPTSGKSYASSEEEPEEPSSSSSETEDPAAHSSDPEESAGQEEPSGTEEPSGQDISTSLAGYDTAFEYDFISYVLENGFEKENFMVSPLSFRAALCLAASGADGVTKEELLKALGFASQEEMEAWYAAVNASVVQFDRDYQELLKVYKDMEMEEYVAERAFSLVNSIWNNSDLAGSFTEEYKELVKEYFNAPAYEKNAADITEAVNSWCEENTNGLIPMISNDLSKTASVLVNALYLKSSWINAFEEFLTEEGEFTDISGNKVLKEFMEQTDRFSYFEDEGTKIVILPLEGGMYFAAVLGGTEDITDKLAAAEYKKVHVRLPKLEIESTFDSSTMIEYLESLGVETAFDGRADFSAMCSETDWCIGDIIQKTKIITDENGLEAAAVTAIMMTETALIEEPEEIMEFVADQPFSFYIYSDLGSESEKLLFAGQCVK